MQQDGIIGMALLSHYGSTNLAQADAMAPSGTAEDELCRQRSVAFGLDHEGGTEQVALTQYTPDFEFLANGHRPFRAFYLQP